MRIDWEGKTYDLDPMRDLTVSRLRVLKAAFGADYGKAVTVVKLMQDGDADAIVSVMWVMKQRAGESCDPRNLPDFAPLEFMTAFQTAEDAEAPEPGVDPTNSSVDDIPASTTTSTS